MTRASDEQIAAMLSKREAIINRLCAEKKQLELQLVKARKALQFYASEWEFDPSDMAVPTLLLEADKGGLARTALTEDQGK